MTDDDFRVTIRDVNDTLIEFRKEFGEYMKEQGPRMALLEYRIKELEEKQKHAEDQGFTEKQNRKLYLWAFAGSSVMLEIFNWILFHK